ASEALLSYLMKKMTLVLTKSFITTFFAADLCPRCGASVSREPEVSEDHCKWKVDSGVSGRSR
ncbi:hypothetical protein JB92DRAFT_2872265, partial [Gautieria morchelliformis]